MTASATDPDPTADRGRPFEPDSAPGLPAEGGNPRVEHSNGAASGRQPDTSGPSPAGGGPVSLLIGDGGAVDRLRRRAAGVSPLPLAAGLVLAATAWWWPGWATGPGQVILALLTAGFCAVAAAALLWRARRWAAAAGHARSWALSWATGAVSAGSAPPGWVSAVCGASKPLHPGTIPLLRRQRRLPPSVLPLRTAAGPLAAGEAVVVHARKDGALPAGGDRIQVWVTAPRGPILIGRLDDGAVFAADRWVAGTA